MKGGNMNYYENRRQALKIIDDMLAEGVAKEHIIYKISTKFGFSKKIVLDRIQQLEDAKNA
jgi:predicted transcriptional regulator